MTPTQCARQTWPGSRLDACLKTLWGFPEIAPDLAIEIKSPGNSWPEISAKAYMWLCYGSQQVWVADPPTATITVYSNLNTAPVTLTEDDVLDGGDLLPGFSTPVWRLFRRRR